jgi:GTP-binding protein YchF
VGLPNVGKSTLFNALTDAGALAANYPFATIEPNEGIVPVPDERLDVLARMYHTDKVVPATVKFVDVAGLVEGASKGEGLGNKFLANIRECDAIIHVVRAFEDSNIQHVSGAPDPTVDVEVINTELMLADIQTLEKHIPKVQKEAKAGGGAKEKLAYLTALQSELLAGKIPTNTNTEYLDGLQLLTTKPVIYVYNVNEAQLSGQSVADTILPAGLPICAKLEEELRALSPVEAAELLADYGVAEPGLNKLVRAAYSILGLQSVLTAGEKEVRAWTIKKGSTAPQAAGVIHTDFERGFIAAQVVDYDDLIKAGSESAARAQGKIRTEGKTYVMQPDDVVEFRFNV